MKKKRNDRDDLITKERARRYARNKCEHVYQAAMAVLFRCLIDKHGFNTDSVNRLSCDVYKLAQEIDEGRVTVKDLIHSLEDEDNIVFDKLYPDRL